MDQYIKTVAVGNDNHFEQMASFICAMQRKPDDKDLLRKVFSAVRSADELMEVLRCIHESKKPSKPRK